MNNANEDFHQNSKQNRRDSLKHKKKTKSDIPDSFRDQNKLKKQFKAKRESIYEEELWQDWEEYNG